MGEWVQDIDWKQVTIKSPVSVSSQGTMLRQWRNFRYRIAIQPFTDQFEAIRKLRDPQKER